MFIELAIGTINTALSGITLDGSIFDNTFGSMAGAIISGSVTSLSQSLSKELQTKKTILHQRVLVVLLVILFSLMTLTSVGISGSFQPASSSISTTD